MGYGPCHLGLFLDSLPPAVDLLRVRNCRLCQKNKHWTESLPEGFHGAPLSFYVYIIIYGSKKKLVNTY